MRAWLFTWNPNRWAWSEGLYCFEEMRQEIEQIGYTINKWSCGSTKSILEGDAIYLIRLGAEPRGIVACGIALSPVFVGTHWSSEDNQPRKQAKRVFVRFDRMCSARDQVRINMDDLHKLSNNFCWSSQSSGITIHSSLAEELNHMLNY